MSNALQAALTLHTLHPDDRAWMLAQLSSSEKDAIRNVSIAHNTQAHPGATGFELAVAVEQRNALPQSSIVTHLNSLDPIQIAGALENEPNWVVAVILGAHRWPWHDTVLDQLGAERRGLVARISYVALPHRVIQSLLSALLERARTIPIRSMPTPSLVPVAESRWSSLKRRMRGIFTWPH